MTWVKKAPAVVEHECAPPVKQIAAAPQGYTEVDGSFGDLWRCDTCEGLWQVDHVWSRQAVARLTWRPASWWQRFKYRKSVDLSESPPPIKGGPIA